ncbi:efflux RND transporter periplasmic adaptor subunit [Methylobacterium iners]|uniref:RND efflux pump membrane fusion protein barrel-sandwich domain-containing protein n=1 Tax=Methylobacterium iners TaxID=418707 RepID=A0ABQ4S7P5_9HYPH|nr:efflux RND transporter periplasmic adaptor subunit [Methylobacterium iners]GJD97695.1 hypothetical protein OCOJLMKI_4928 [Methylobacterium iners]
MSPGCDATRPHTLTITGTPGLDADAPVVAHASGPGRVVEVFRRTGARVDRNEPILRAMDPETSDDGPGRFVTTPVAGLLLSAPTVGTCFAADTALFQVLGHAVVTLQLHPYHGPIDRESITRCTVRSGAGTWSATLRRFEERPEGPRLQLAVSDPDGRLPLGASVTVEVAVEPTPAMAEAVFAARRAARPYKLPPRGLERVYLGLATPTAPRTVATAPQGRRRPYDPARAFERPRPPRDPAPFALMGDVSRHAAKAHRSALGLSPDAWRRLKIGVFAARSDRISDHVNAIARIERITAGAQAHQLTAAVAGTLSYAPGLAPGDVVAPGQRLATIQVTLEMLAAQEAYLAALTPRATEAEHLRDALGALGLDAVHLNTLRRRQMSFAKISLVAPLAGMVEDLTAKPGEVAASTTLLTLTPANTAFAVLHLDPAEFERLSPQVGARWRNENMDRHPEAGLPLLEVQAVQREDGNERIRVRLPLPTSLAASVPAGLPCLQLDTPDTRRDAVLVPADCLVTLGRSQEVLLQIGAGQLRPTSVAVGLAADGYVEITDGVQAGDSLVRDLAALSREDQRIRALMAGFWDPSPRRARRPSTEQPFNPLL